MPSLKNRWMKPGSSLNYTEGCLVQAAAPIVANDIVHVVSATGPFPRVGLAQANGTAVGSTSCGNTRGRLLIAKHDIPTDGYGVCVPWRLISGVDTSSAAAEEPIVLSGAAGGKMVFASAITNAEVQKVVIGRVCTVGTAGTVLLDTRMEAPTPRSADGSYARENAHFTPGTDLFGALGLVISVGVPDSSSTAITLAQDILILDVWGVDTTTDSSVGTCTLTNTTDGTTIGAFATGSGVEGTVARAPVITARLAGEGDVLTWTNTTEATSAHILFIYNGNNY